jgi:hypothetical protein
MKSQGKRRTPLWNVMLGRFVWFHGSTVRFDVLVARVAEVCEYMIESALICLE